MPQILPPEKPAHKLRLTTPLRSRCPCDRDIVPSIAISRWAPIFLFTALPTAINGASGSVAKHELERCGAVRRQALGYVGQRNDPYHLTMERGILGVQPAIRGATANAKVTASETRSALAFFRST
jgi:hypothetical protein